MKFEAIAREAVLLDPSDNLARKTIPNEIVFSVECGTIEQAQRSIKHLKSLV